ncbi:MAG: S-adenosyl-l-methionine hydroxide adenosyltransferase family protein [Acidimicrobiia bacterium]
MTLFDTISFLSDYGLVDEFVGVVKAVVRDLAPHVGVVDITHGVAPFDVRAGSLALARVIQYVPSGVVLAVVDPGVGTERRAVAIEVASGEGVLVGPDNGLLAPAVAMAGGAERAVVLDNSEYHLAAPGPTFAGRDIFGPAAAYLCNGVDLYELGTPVDPGVLMPGLIPVAHDEGDELVAEVLWVDRYGNAQLNLGPDDIERFGERVQLRVDDRTRVASRASTFGNLVGGEVGLIVDSYGLVAIALDRRSAADELQLGAGDSVRLADAGEGADPRPRITTPVTFRR